jgi:predicted nuclease of restriction endonuclease-like RecB superfamily
VNTDGRRCSIESVCRHVMAAERRRVFSRINELAVDDGEHAEVARYLAGEFPTPGTLLGGPDADGAR